MNYFLLPDLNCIALNPGLCHDEIVCTDPAYPRWRLRGNNVMRMSKGRVDRKSSLLCFSALVDTTRTEAICNTLVPSLQKLRLNEDGRSWIKMWIDRAIEGDRDQDPLNKTVLETSGESQGLLEMIHLKQVSVFNYQHTAVNPFYPLLGPE